MAIRVQQPPSAFSDEAWRWMKSVADALNFMPPMSYISTANGPNVSGVSAERGTLGIEVNSSTTTIVWVKSTSSGTQGWLAIK